MTKIYGILAHPARHSLSPAIFNAAFLAEGINARYEVFDVESLEKFLKMLARGRKISRLENSSPGYICGLSVSLPYKESILKYLDEMSEDVRAIGACNTVKITDIQNSDGSAKKIASGFNTDWIGFIEALKEKIASVKELNVVVLGAGGAARAIVYGLIKEGAKVVVLNRTVEKAAKIAKDFENIRADGGTTEGNRADENNRATERDRAIESDRADIQFGALEELENFKCDVLVQATSVWLDEKEVDFVSEEYLQKNKPLVFDIVYKPLITPLLQSALNSGCKIITGDKMLLNQAVKQFEIWFDKKAPKEVMSKAMNTDH